MTDEELMQRLHRNADPLVQAAVSKIHALAESNARLRQSQMLMIVGAAEVLSHIPDRAGYLSATQLYKLQNSAQLLKDAK